ncbi:MAG: hypothetical protein LBJ00_09725 [Planctomycetaceae bacterium]|nr:hypothetical protein [Planctomycetaceae bacterium]
MLSFSIVIYNDFGQIQKQDTQTQHCETVVQGQSLPLRDVALPCSVL